MSILASLAVGWVSLYVLPDGVAYDPWSWLIWGRELAHLHLSTRGAASSFKPLPVAVTALFAWTGRADPDIWLVVARAGAAMAIFLAFRLGCRLSGPAAGLVAVGGLLCDHELVDYLVPAGMSEPLLAACCLGAVDAHLSGRRRAAVLLLVGASLLRIELSAFLAVYCLVWIVARARHRVRSVAALLLIGAAVGAAWLLPDLLTAGNALRSASRATIPTGGGPLLTPHPGLATLQSAARLMFIPLSAAVLAELVHGTVSVIRRRRPRPSFPLAVGAVALALMEAAMAQLRLATGSSRFLLPAVAAGAVAAGCVWADLAAAALRHCHGVRTRAVVAVVIAAAAIATARTDQGNWLAKVRGGLRSNHALAVLDRRLPEAVDAAGGRQRILACGPVATTPLEVPAVAWALHLPMASVASSPRPTGTILSTGIHRPPIRSTSPSAYHVVAAAASAAPWRTLTTCSERDTG